MQATLVRVSRVCLTVIAFAAHSAHAQKGYFQHPLRIIVPFAPGGGADTQARRIAARLTEITGQPVVVDNRAGGAGIIAAEATLRAPPDGHTMDLVGTTFTVAPSLTKLPFDPLKDFTPVTRISTTPATLVVHASLPANSVRDLIRLAKGKPSQITFASAGVASQSHLSGELFKQLAGIDIVHVPYKGAGPATTALISGESVMSFSNAVASLPLARAGKLKLLAVTTPQRSPFLPDIPTVAEAGVPGFESRQWNGMIVSSATPRPAVAALHEALQRVLQAPDLKEQLAQDASAPMAGDTPSEFAAFMKAEVERWARVIREARIKAD